MKKIIIPVLIIFILILIVLLGVNENNINLKLIGNDENKKIVYELIEDYFNYYYSSNAPKDLKLAKHTIKEINVISKEDEKIIAQFKAKIVPRSLSHAWATTDIDYYLTIEIVDGNWKIINKATSL